RTDARSNRGRSRRSATSSRGAVSGRPDMTASRVGKSTPNSTGMPISYVLVIRGGAFAALRTPTYRRYWLGVVCYVLGHRAEYVTYAWMMWQLTESPLHLGYLRVAQGVPLLVFQLVGGVLADR